MQSLPRDDRSPRSPRRRSLCCWSRSCTGSSRRLGRRSLLLTELTEHAHRPFQVAATVLAVQFGVRFGTGYAVGAGLAPVVLHLLVLAASSPPPPGWSASLLVVARGHRAGPVPGRRAGQPAGPPGQDPGGDAAPGDHRGDRDR